MNYCKWTVNLAIICNEKMSVVDLGELFLWGSSTDFVENISIASFDDDVVANSDATTETDGTFPYDLGTVRMGYDYEKNNNINVTYDTYKTAYFGRSVDQTSSSLSADSTGNAIKGDGISDDGYSSYIFKTYSDKTSTYFDPGSFLDKDYANLVSASDIFLNNSSTNPFILYSHSLSLNDYYMSDGSWNGVADGTTDADTCATGSKQDVIQACTPAKEVYFSVEDDYLDNITYITDEDGGLIIGTGTVTYANVDIADGTSAYANFQYGVSDTTVKLTTTTTSETSTSTTSGTTSSYSNTATASVGLTLGSSVTAGVEATVGVESVSSTTASVSATYSSEVETAYEEAWETTQEVSFSETTTDTLGEESTKSVEVTFDGSDATETDEDGNTYNDGTYTYENDEGETETTGIDLYTGVWYTVALKEVDSTISNTVSGTYQISGTPGPVTYSYEAATGSHTSEPTYSSATLYQGSSAEILEMADNYDAATVLGYEEDAFDFSDGTAKFTGTSTGSTSVSTSFFVTVYETDSGDDDVDDGDEYDEDALIKPESKALVSRESASNLGLTNTLGDVVQYDLGLVNRYKKTNVGFWLNAYSKDGDTVTVTGGNSSNNVVRADSTGNYKYTKFKSSLLYGNDNGDLYKFKKASKGNTIQSMGGDDQIVSHVRTIADLGDGDDVYKIRNGSHHLIKTGSGEDKVVIKNINNYTGDHIFQISDFSPFEDSIGFRGNYDESLISTELVLMPGSADKKTSETTALDYAIDLKYDDDIIGKIYLNMSSESGFMNFFTGNRSILADLALLNTDKLNTLDILSTIGKGENITALELLEMFVESRGIVNSKHITPSSWSDLSISKRNRLRTKAWKALGSEVSNAEWKDFYSGLLPTINNKDFDISTFISHGSDFSGLSSDALSVFDGISGSVADASATVTTVVDTSTSAVENLI